VSAVETYFCGLAAGPSPPHFSRAEGKLSVLVCSTR